MKSDSIGEFLALILAVLFVLVGMWFNLTQPPSGPLPDCEYGFTENCE